MLPTSQHGRYTPSRDTHIYLDPSQDPGQSPDQESWGNYGWCVYLCISVSVCVQV